MNRFSSKSQERLSTCHSDLILIMDTVLDISNIDFGIAEGHRTTEKQKQYYAEGKSKLDGVTNMSKHQSLPSTAVDIYAYFDNKAQWHEESLSYLAGVVHAVAELLYIRGEITHKVRWGGNWDRDGKILLDQSFDDRPHFELIKVKHGKKRIHEETGNYSASNSDST